MRSAILAKTAMEEAAARGVSFRGGSNPIAGIMVPNQGNALA